MTNKKNSALTAATVQDTQSNTILIQDITENDESQFLNMLKRTKYVQNDVYNLSETLKLIDQAGRAIGEENLSRKILLDIHNFLSDFDIAFQGI